MLITTEDLDRLARLEIEREGDHDVVWACRLARKLAWLKPTEAEFQEYIAIINHMACTAMTLRHDETVFLETLEPSFVREFSCLAVEAFLCVRPYVILEHPRIPERISALEKCRWKATVDGKPLAAGWMAEILVGLDGYGIRRKSYVFPLPNDPIDKVFGTGFLQPNMNHGPLDYMGQSVLPANLGVFLGAGAKLEITLDVPPELSVKLKIGLVAARYTTRARLCAAPPPASERKI